MSKQALVVEFTKMHGAGNDFIIIDNRFYYFTNDEQVHLAKALCKRHFDIGADGLIVLNATEGGPVAMAHYNPDGGRATLCGNGTRCAAAYALHAGMAEGPGVTLETPVGHLEATVGSGGGPMWYKVTTSMPVPELQDVWEDPRVQGALYQIWSGTEHAVYEGTADIEFEVTAPAIRHAKQFGAKGTNVNEVSLHVAGQAQIRTYEKGVEGETLACGTGAVAAALVLRHLGVEATPLQIKAKGGDLFVYPGDTAWQLEGPAQVVFRGSFEYRPT